jgi:hypothetical protein
MEEIAKELKLKMYNTENCYLTEDKRRAVKDNKQERVQSNY